MLFVLNPDLRQLRYFVAVAEELHFSRAAERIGIAQPPLTQQIQKLEAALGCPLLVRGRKTVLTPAGEVLLEQARRLLEQADRAMDMTRRTGRGESGHLTVGVPPSVMLSGLPNVIWRYRRQHPDVAFTLRELSTSAIEDAVRSGEVDLGFLRETEPAAPLTSEILLREPVVVVLPAAHPLAGRGMVRLAALRSEPFVLFPRRLGPAFYDRLIGAWRPALFRTCSRKLPNGPPSSPRGGRRRPLPGARLHPQAPLARCGLPARAFASYRRPGVLACRLRAARRRRLFGAGQGQAPLAPR